MKTPELEANPQVWHHWLNHFESTEKVTYLIEQVSVI